MAVKLSVTDEELAVVVLSTGAARGGFHRQWGACSRRLGHAVDHLVGDQLEIVGGVGSLCAAG